MCGWRDGVGLCVCVRVGGVSVYWGMCGDLFVWGKVCLCVEERICLCWGRVYLCRGEGLFVCGESRERYVCVLGRKEGSVCV